MDDQFIRDSLRRGETKMDAILDSIGIIREDVAELKTKSDSYSHDIFDIQGRCERRQQICANQDKRICDLEGSSFAIKVWGCICVGIATVMGAILAFAKFK